MWTGYWLSDYSNSKRILIAAYVDFATYTPQNDIMHMRYNLITSAQGTEGTEAWDKNIFFYAYVFAIIECTHM